MRLLSISVLVIVGLTACQQQEPNSVPKAEQSKTVAPVESVVKAESATVAVQEVVSEADEKMAEKVPAEEVVATSADESAKAVEKLVNSKISAQPAMLKPAVIAEVPAKASEPAVETAVVSEIAVPASAEKPSGDPMLGAKVAKKCVVCHTFNQGGKNKTGPNLSGVVGRIKGSAPGFKYGLYLKAENGAGAVWNEADLRGWVENSKAVAKAAGTTSKMPAQKITGEKADNLIAYLKTL